jgi:hypothetical protein
MSADADHEVIDSPEALFRHLYEAHHVEEALDLDPADAPVHFWLRRHADLEREARAAPRPEEPARDTRAAPRPEEPGPRPDAPAQPPPRGAREPSGRPAPRRSPPRPAPFGDPLVEAVARALAGRGYDEAAVRGAIRGYASSAGGRTGEAAVRGDLVEPMLRAAAERLLRARPAPPPPQAPAATRAQEPPQAATRREGDRREADRPEESRPEAAWAVLWADLGDAGGRRARPTAAAADGAEDDLMAVADAVQRRRGRRPAEREPRPLRR